ncbi:flagellin [Aquibacillus halophilus]|uniref:Flagellin n=1 Tax=Aquibacillus halophilus TaxID=930132 RepID=A0A6A8D891_9BACI|nr:flagellin [Aquibacillus halophilus]MRH41975.1 flagellin [Aquibacillus halophilus]
MRINHNIAALNTHRQLGQAQNAQQNSMEKLSSGLRINGAKDDAAGLAISEKMRAQVRGLEQASTNAQDANSLIQTAEGALNESHSILQRMRELATQSANDTNTGSDRNEIQKEVDQLSQELSRIGNTTEFNTQNLLSGNFKGTFQIGANEGQNITLDISDMRALDLGVVGGASTTIDPATAIAHTQIGTTDDLASTSGTFTVGHDGTDYQLKDSAGNVVAKGSDGKTFTGTGTDLDGSAFGDDEITLTDTAKIGGEVVLASGDVDKFDAQIDNSLLQSGTYTATTTELKDEKGNVIATSTNATDYALSDGSGTFSFGAAIDADTELKVGGIDVSTQKSANSAITDINDAIETVSSERSKLGAVQNRLDHTINNLGTSSENLTAAESRIRDVDMAKEMMNQTKNSILAQAAQAMLAQANSAPQGVLQLLQ